MSKCTLLVVDDSSDDLALMELAVKKACLPVHLRTFEKSSEALLYLNGVGKYADRQVHPLPRLIILDLKMPCINGFELIEELQRAGVPTAPPFVVILSSSELDQDIERAHALGVSAYHTKPADFFTLCELMSNLVSFFCLASLPEA